VDLAAQVSERMPEVPAKITAMVLRAGLDAHLWSTVNHAYLSTEDLPGLLRTFVGGREDAQEVPDELNGSIVHHGTVYVTSVGHAPYLARIAVSGQQRSRLGATHRARPQRPHSSSHCPVFCSPVRGAPPEPLGGGPGWGRGATGRGPRSRGLFGSDSARFQIGDP
jgi:hypothetical protein